MTARRRGPADKRTARHTLRTLIQVLVALAGVIPTTAAAFGLSAAVTAKVAATAGLVMVIVTAIHNAAEQTGALPVLLPNPQAPNAESAAGQVAGDTGHADPLYALGAAVVVAVGVLVGMLLYRAIVT